MKPARPVVQSGSFVAGAAGTRLRIVTEPADGALRGTVVFVHAFAEEMNKSRRMAARMARLLAGDGWHVVQRDLSGCGDSSGEFVEATWQAWLDDVDDELERGTPDLPVWLWAERAGALLACAACSKQQRAINLLLWQPVVSGAQHLQQFLRLHAGARIVGSAKADDGPAPLQRLRSGATVEVGGYELNPALAAGMERTAFDLPAEFRGRVIWLEVVSHPPAELSPASARVVHRLSERGITVTARAVNGAPFWQTQEIEDCDALLAQTLELMRDGAAASEARRSGSERTPTPHGAPQ